MDATSYVNLHAWHIQIAMRFGLLQGSGYLPLRRRAPVVTIDDLPDPDAVALSEDLEDWEDFAQDRLSTPAPWGPPPCDTWMRYYYVYREGEREYFGKAWH